MGASSHPLQRDCSQQTPIPTPPGFVSGFLCTLTRARMCCIGIGRVAWSESAKCACNTWTTARVLL